MAVIIKAFPLLALSVLLFQVLICEAAPEGEKPVADDEKPTSEHDQTPEIAENKNNEPTSTSEDKDAETEKPNKKAEEVFPKPWEDLIYSRFPEVNTAARKMTEVIETTRREMILAENAVKMIKPLRSASSVKKALTNIFKSLGSDCEAKKKKVTDQLCFISNRLETKLASTVALAKTMADTVRPEFLNIMGSVDAGTGFEDKIKCLIIEHPVFHIDEEEINKKVNPEDFPENIYGKKTLAYRKIFLAHAEMLEGVKHVDSEANLALNIFYNGLVGVKNIINELKSTQEYPEDTAEEEAKIKTALALGKFLGCSNDKINDANKKVAE